MIRIEDMLKNVNRDPRWQGILDEQERLLRLSECTCAQALTMGNEIVRLAGRMGKAMAVQIVLDGAVAFSCHMDGTTRFHDWFIEQKANVVRETGLSSMRAFLNCVYGGQYADRRWFRRDGNFVLCGGSIPLILTDATPVGILTVSGGSHEEDHQLAAEAVAAVLGLKIPSILDP